MSDLRVRPLVTHNLLKSYAEQSKPEAAKESGFADLLKQSIAKVQEAKASADLAVNEAIMGRGEDLHQVMIAQEESSITFELMMEVRNKLLEAYQQIMSMQI